MLLRFKLDIGSQNLAERKNNIVFMSSAKNGKSETLLTYLERELLVKVNTLMVVMVIKIA